MFDKAEILARLQDGNTVDDIAKEMAEALNAAKADYAEETARIAKEEEMAKAREAQKAEKREEFAHIVFELCEYMSKYVPDSEEFVDTMRTLTAKEYDDIADGLESVVKTFEDLKNFKFNIPGFQMKRENKEKEKKYSGIFADDPIFSWFKLLH